MFLKFKGQGDLTHRLKGVHTDEKAVRIKIKKKHQ